MSIIGIDAGSSCIKAIQTDIKGKIINKQLFEKTSIIEALELFLKHNNINKKDVEKIVLTGVGKDEIKENIYEISTEKVDEFKAIATGGLELAKKQEALVISIGTGTAFVMANNNKYKHIGGTGVGGGTLLNLCKLIGNINTIEDINKEITKGNLENVDLTVQDVTEKEIQNLPKDTTSANFGKLNDKANKADLILGIANMIFETIGMMAVFRHTKYKLQEYNCYRKYCYNAIFKNSFK